jgi:LysR family nitrogen assimilation transcriptional regulator
MELRQLRYFVSVAKLESYVRASAHLNVAQSALSRQIRMLEEEIGQKLLDRTGRGATPTLVGRLLLQRASTLLADVDELKSAISVIAGVAGNVRLGIPAAFNATLTSRILERCRDDYPNVRLQICEGLSSTLLEWLLDGRIDLAVLYSHQAVNQSVIVAEVDTQPMWLIHAPGIVPSAKPPIDLRTIAHLPLIVLERPNGSRLAIDEAFARADLKPSATLEVSAWLLLKEFLLSGKGYALLPISEVQGEIDSGRLIATPLESPKVMRTLCIARNHSKTVSSTTGEIFQFIHRQRDLWFSHESKLA